jgi:hypothetical protein
MNAYGGVDVQTHVFFTSALVAGEWSGSHQGRFTPGERAPGTHWIGGWVGPKAGVDDTEKWKFLTSPGIELRPLCPASSQSLYRLSYPGSLCGPVLTKILKRRQILVKFCRGRFAEVGPQLSCVGKVCGAKAILNDCLSPLSSGT